MAGNIKGITIEFRGDTTKLGTALREINTKTKEVDRALKDVNTALKFNPGNTELLAQKQMLLKEKIEQTKDKLEALRQAQAKLDDDPAVDNTSKEYQELRREIIETESKLGHFEKELKRLNNIKLEELGKSMEKVGGKMKSMGKSMTQYVTAPIVAGGTAAAKTFADVDKTMALTNKTMGNSTTQAELLDKAMRDAAANSTYGMDDAATATLNFARAGLTAEEAASALAPAMNLAAGEGGNLDTVSAGLVATINGFGGSFEEAAEYADVFANACNNSALDIDSLSSAMSVAAPIFKSAGYDVQDAALYMGVMANKGIDANTAANALKTGMARLVSPSKEASTWLNKLGVEVTNADGSMKDSVTVQKELHDAFGTLSESEQIAAASAIFGKNQMSNWLALINTAPDDVATLNASLEEMGTTEAMAAAMMEGFGGSIEKLKSGINVAAYNLGKALAPTIQKVLGVVQKAVDWFNNLSESQQQTVAKVLALVAAIGPLLVISGSLLSVTGKMLQSYAQFGKLIPGLSGGFGKLFGILKAHPIGLIIAALAALTTAFIATGGDADAFAEKIKGMVSKASEFVQALAKKLPEMMPVITQAATDLFRALADALPVVLPEVIDALIALVMALVDALPQLVPTLLDGALTLFGALVDAIPIIVPKVLEALGQLVVKLIEYFPQFYKTMLEATIKLWSQILEALKHVFGLIKEYLPQIVALVATGLADKLSGLWDKIKTTAKEKWEGIKKAVIEIITKWLSDVVNFFAQHLANLKKHWDDVKTAAKEKWNSIKENVTEKVKTLKQNAEKLFGEHLTNLKRNWDETKQAANDKWSAIKDNVTKKVEKLKGDLAGFWEKIKTGAGDAWNKVKDAILKPIETMKDKIRDIINTIKGWFSNFSIRTPHIKLPHPYISPKGWTLADLLDGITPSIDIDWYKTGGIFDSPTLAGIGEAGAEAVVPLDKFWSKMDSMADSIVNGLIVGLRTMQVQGAGPESVTIPIYLYPSGPKMGEETVKMYDTYKRRLG